MLRRKKSSYFDEKLAQNVKHPKELWKTLRFLGLNAKERKKLKVSLHKSGINKFEPRENANIFKKFYSKLATDLVKKNYQMHLINLIAVPLKITILIYLTKETTFVYSVLLKYQ